MSETEHHITLALESETLVLVKHKVTHCDE